MAFGRSGVVVLRESPNFARQADRAGEGSGRDLAVLWIVQRVGDG